MAPQEQQFRRPILDQRSWEVFGRWVGERQFSYDTDGNIEQIVDNDGGTIDFQYSTDGDMELITDVIRGDSTMYTYTTTGDIDKMNRTT